MTTLLLCAVKITNAQLNSFSVNGIVELRTDSSSITSDSLNYITCKITISDTTTIQSINIKLGNSLHSGNLIDTSFIFDVTTGLPQGTTYLRKGNTIFIGLGYHPAGFYFMDVKLEDVFGNLSITKPTRF
jgi:hypothetical protein